MKTNYTHDFRPVPLTTLSPSELRLILARYQLSRRVKVGDNDGLINSITKLFSKRGDYTYCSVVVTLNSDQRTVNIPSEGIAKLEIRAFLQAPKLHCCTMFELNKVEQGKVFSRVSNILYLNQAAMMRVQGGKAIDISVTRQF